MKKPNKKEVYATLILTTGYTQEEALKRVVLGIFGFGTILGDKIQTSTFDVTSEDHSLMLPDDKMLSGWLAVDEANRQMVDLDVVEQVVNETIENLKVKAEEIQKEVDKKGNKIVN